jgi:hypothetical protein
VVSIEIAGWINKPGDNVLGCPNAAGFAAHLAAHLAARPEMTTGTGG